MLRALKIVLLEDFLGSKNLKLLAYTSKNTNMILKVNIPLAIRFAWIHLQICRRSLRTDCIGNQGTLPPPFYIFLRECKRYFALRSSKRNFAKHLSQNEDSINCFFFFLLVFESTFRKHFKNEILRNFSSNFNFDKFSRCKVSRTCFTKNKISIPKVWLPSLCSPDFISAYI